MNGVWVAALSVRKYFCRKMTISGLLMRWLVDVQQILARRKHRLCCELTSASIESRCFSRAS